MNTREQFEAWCNSIPANRSMGPWEIWQASRTAALEEAIENIHALRASHIADAPTCDYVSCDFVSAWDDAVAAVRALAKGEG